MAKKRTRVVLTSGGLEPVLDSGGAGGHSVFASAFLKALKNNSEIMDGTTLFTQVRRPVMLNASQTPEYADIKKINEQKLQFGKENLELHGILTVPIRSIDEKTKLFP